MEYRLSSIRILLNEGISKMNTGIDNIIDEGLDYFEDSEEDELIAFREMV